MNRLCPCGSPVSIPRVSELCDDCLMRVLGEIEREKAVEDEINRQIYIMQTPRHWLKKPFLPLVRHLLSKPEPQCGFLYLHPTEKPNLMPTVYLGLIYSVAAASTDLRQAKIARVRLSSHDEVVELKQLNYPTFASIYHSGWRVDE